MITLITPQREADFITSCGFDEIIGARMVTLLRCYGYAPDICGLWLMQNAGGAPTAAIGRFDGWLVISAARQADLPELSAFAGAIGQYKYVEAAPFVLKGMGISGRYASSYMMRYAGRRFSGDFSDITANPPPRQIYEILCAASPGFTADWPAWYTHTSHVFRHGLGFGGMIYAGQTPVATGGVYTQSDEIAVIGCLATLPRHRGKGFAARLTKYLVNTVLDMGKTPALFCAQDSLAEYYAAFGFTPAGKWAEITIDDL